MSYNNSGRILKAEFQFKTLKIKLYEEDFEHALDNHPGEVSLKEIGNCIENPDTVIESRQGKNACLFYQKKIKDEFFVVVVHTTTVGDGEVRTAYMASYIKKGRVLYNKENLWT